MAFDGSDEQQDDDTLPGTTGQTTQGQGAPTGAQASTALSGGSGGLAGGSAAPSAGTTGQAATPGTYSGGPSSSGSWTNVNSYLNANQDQAPALGQTIANTVGTQAAQSESDLNAVQQGFQNEAPYQAINSTNDATIDQNLANAGQYSSTTSPQYTQAEDWLNNTYGSTDSNNNITDYGASTVNADGTETPSSTTGPTWSTVQNDYTTANQNLQDTQSESGRQQLLQNQYGQNGNYSQGDSLFDQLLLQQNPQNQSALSSVYNQYAPGEVNSVASTTNPTQNAASQSGLPMDLYNAIQSSQNYNTNEQALATGYQTEAQNDLANQISGLGTGLQGEVSADNANYLNTYNQLASALQSGNLSQAQQQGIGLQGGPIDTYGANASNYLQALANASPYTANSAATTGDWQNYMGLNNLLSGYSGTNQANDQAALANVGLTGTQASAPTVASPYSNFNTGNFNAQIANNQTAYNDQLSQLDQSGWNIASGPHNLILTGGQTSPFGNTQNPQGLSTAQQQTLLDQDISSIGQYESANPNAASAWGNVNGWLSQAQALDNENTYFDPGGS